VSGDAIVYVAELDLPEDARRDFFAWYAGRHAPDLHQAGFSTCTSYRAVEGGMAIVDLYETPRWEVLASEAYRRAGERDGYAAPLLAARTDFTHTVYAYHPRWPASRCAPLDADWVTLLRFGASEAAEAALLDWLEAEGAARFAAAGARQLRPLRRGRDHPVLKSRRPRCALVVEWVEPPPDHAHRLDALPARLGLEPDLGFTGVRTHPWPDRVALRLD